MPKITELRGLFKPFTKPLHRHWKYVWQEKGKFNEPKLTLPKALEGRQLNIIDPLHEPDPNAVPDESTPWISPTRHPMFEYLAPPLPRDQHPLFHHDKPVFLFDSKTKLHAGVDQACLLTKTIPFYELPQSIKQDLGQITLPNQDDLIQSYIRQSIAYDATKEHLPRKTTPLKQRRSFRVEYSVPRSRQMAILLENILYLCESLGGRYPDLFKRHLYRNTPFRATFERYGEPIHLRKKNEYVLTSPLPLPPIVKRLDRLEISAGDNLNEKIASHDPNGHYLAKASDYQFLNMYPIYPTIDLPKEQLYQDGDEQGWKPRKSNEHVHTTFYVSNDELIHESTTDERLARMIMFAFGSALVQARQQYPNGILTKPVTVQSVFLLDELFHFVVFQLNTLNYNDTKDQRHNFVWIDKDNYLYDNRPSLVMQNPVYGTERNLQRYVLERLQYNPTVFQKFLALYLQDFFCVLLSLNHPSISDEAKAASEILQSNMNTGAKWGIAIGAGIPCVLILIGLIGLLIKFFMKRCQKKAWDDISSLPKKLDASGNNGNRRPIKRLTSEHEPLYPETPTNNNLETPEGHIVVPIDENDLPPGQRHAERTKQHEHTLVQIQRDRLNRLKEEENRLRPMMPLNHGEDDIQHAIDQAQKEFEESVANASAKLKLQQEK